MTVATPKAWHHPNKRRYGNPESYVLASRWLRPCADVADWGAGGAHFRKFIDHRQAYTAIDGTPQLGTDVVADLSLLVRSSDGILLRHVVDNTPDWMRVLGNALGCFRRRMVVITFTPDVAETVVDRYQHGWPVWHFNPADLRGRMGSLLVGEEETLAVPERIYYLEKPS